MGFLKVSKYLVKKILLVNIKCIWIQFSVLSNYKLNTYFVVNIYSSSKQCSLATLILIDI